MKKETLAKEFSCTFYDISKNTYFTEHLLVTATEFHKQLTYTKQEREKGDLEYNKWNENTRKIE